MDDGVITGAVYARISKEDSEKELLGEDSKLSIQNQLSNAHKWAQEHKVIVPQEFVYNEEIGKSWDSDRIEYNRLKSDMKSQKWRVLVVKDGSRIGRDQAERMSFIQDAKALGTKIFSYVSSEDLTNNLIISGVMAAVDSQVIAKGKDDSQRMQDEKTNLTHLPFGRPPKGYSTKLIKKGGQQVKTWKTNKDADEVRHIFEELCSDSRPSMFVLAKKYAMSRPAIRHLLHNSAYCGIRIWYRKHRGSGGKILRTERKEYELDQNIPRIITKELFDKAQNILPKKKPRWSE